MKKVYIAGAISRDRHYKEKFAYAAKVLQGRDKDYAILNPAALPDGMTPQDYMQLCTQMLFAADMVAFLPDWSDSEGAGIEFRLCTYIKKDIIVLPWSLFNAPCSHCGEYEPIYLMRDGRCKYCAPEEVDDV